MENSQILIIGQVDVKSPEFLCLTRRLQATFSVLSAAMSWSKMYKMCFVEAESVKNESTVYSTYFE